MATFRLLDWLNLNSYRSYPIKEDTIIDIPNTFIVDFKLVAKKTEPRTVTLSSITAAGNVIFKVDNTEILITKPAGDSSRYLRFLEDTEDFTISIVLGGGPDNAIIDKNNLNYAIEESCYISQDKYRVDTITGDDTLYGLELYDAGIIPVTPSATSITGDLIIECGYNISAAILGPVIHFTVAPGFGDIPGDHCLRLHKDIDCRKAISTINGVAPDTKGTIDFTIGSNIDSKVTSINTIELKSKIKAIKPYCRESVTNG